MEENTKKRGRPPKDAADKRTEVIYLKLTADEKAEIESVASEPSVWVRSLALAAARRKAKASGASQH